MPNKSPSYWSAAHELRQLSSEEQVNFGKLENSLEHLISSNKYDFNNNGYNSDKEELGMTPVWYMIIVC